MNRKMNKWGAAALVVAITVTACGCGTGREFRTIAGPAVQTGVSSILNGLLDGVFAVIAPNPVSGTTPTN